MNIISHQRKNRLTVLQLEQLLLKKRTESVRERFRDPFNGWMNSSNSISTGLSVSKAMCHEAQEKKESVPHNNLVKSRLDRMTVNPRYSRFKEATQSADMNSRNNSAITDSLQMKSKSNQFLNPNSRFWFPKIIEELKLEEAEKDDSSNHSDTIAQDAAEEDIDIDSTKVAVSWPQKINPRNTFHSQSRPSRSSYADSKSKNSYFRSSSFFKAKAENVTNKVVDRVGRSSENFRSNVNSRNVIRHSSQVKKIKKRQSTVPSSSSFKSRPSWEPPQPKLQNRIKRSRFAFRANVRRPQVQELQLLEETPEEQQKELPPNVRKNKKMATILMRYVQSCQKQKIVQENTRPQTPDEQSDVESRHSQKSQKPELQIVEEQPPREDTAEMQSVKMMQLDEGTAFERNMGADSQIPQKQENVEVINQTVEVDSSALAPPEAMLDLERNIKYFYKRKLTHQNKEKERSNSLSDDHQVKLDLTGERRRAAEEESRIIRKNLECKKQPLVQLTPSNLSRVKTDEVRVYKPPAPQNKAYVQLHQEPNKQIKKLLRKCRKTFPIFFQSICRDRVLS